MALRNLITDVAGVTVGHADDARLASGVTAIVFDEPAVASIDVRGGGTGTRESVLLDPSMTVERIDAIALAGGSAFGLDAASGVMAWLAEQGRGYRDAHGARADRAGRDPVRPAQRRRQGLGPLSRPIASSATRRPPPPATTFTLGTAGAGFGATTANFKGGLGSASRDRRRHHGRRAGRGQRGRLRHRRNGTVVLGGAVRARCRVRRPRPAVAVAVRRAGLPHQGRAAENTTLAVVATDAALNKVQAKRLAIMAQVGIAACDAPRAHPARRRPRVHGRDRPPAAARSRSTAWPSSAPPPPTYWRARWRARSMRRPRCPSRGRCRPGATGMEPRDNASLREGPAALTLTFTMAR